MTRLSLLLGLVFCATQFAFAQTQTTAEISGIVTDASGAVVQKANVNAVGKETGIQRATETNSDGLYSLPLLPPGTYMLTVKAQGFQTVTREGIILAIDHLPALTSNCKSAQSKLKSRFRVARQSSRQAMQIQRRQ